MKNWPLRWKVALYSGSFAVAATLAGATTTWFIMRHSEIAAFDRRLTTDAEEFFRDVEWMGLQRHLKVLGIFARIRYRDGKPGYVEDTPRFIAYVRPVVRRYRELAPLAQLIDRLEQCTPTVGYTF